MPLIILSIFLLIIAILCPMLILLFLPVVFIFMITAGTLSHFGASPETSVTCGLVLSIALPILYLNL